MATTDARNPNGHAHTGASISETQCPYCGQSISRQEFREIQARMKTEAEAHIADVERGLATKAKAEIEKAKRDAAAQVEKTQRQALEREATIRREAIQAATAEVTSKVAEAVSAERSKMLVEKIALEQKLGELQRRVRAEPAHLIGEPAEQDLYSRLTEAFAPDQVKVTRVGKGVNGPDLFIDILEAGASIGRLAIECKQHTRWSNRFVTKLKSDSEGADFGVLSTSTMPAAAVGSRLHILDGMIIVDPSLVPALVSLLRRQIVEVHRQKLTGRARDQKGEALLTFVASARCRDQFDKLAKLTSDIADLDAKELATHEGVWRKRGDLIRSLNDTHAEYVTSIDRIISGNGPVPV